MSTAILPIKEMIVGSLYNSRLSRGAPSLLDAILDKKRGFHLAFNSNGSFETDFRDAALVGNLLAADCKKLSIACLQSLYDIEQTNQEKHCLPWNLIRYYYAAFYAANVIIKIFGVSSSWLDSVHTQQLNQLAQLAPTSNTFSITRGLYAGKLSTSGSQIVWTKQGGQTGGTHESLWKTFCEVLKNAEDIALNSNMPSSISQSTAAKLMEFRDVNDLRGSETWLSQIRNDVQYRMQHRVWHSTGLETKRAEKIKTVMHGWKSDPLNITITQPSSDYLLSFCASCSFVLALFKTLLLYLHETSDTKTKSFVSIGPLAFASQAKLSLT